MCTSWSAGNVKVSTWGKVYPMNANQSLFSILSITQLIEAVVLAAAGGHNMLMVGEPG